ncbi:protein-disulfide reductase DsbD family protein [Vineibacter terrae]|uniref:protein-disulfide reductase DsbD family protein n=1 Tax=Vineibacter terrae TaxID=2586908 RepID=UPI002E3427FB|nr:protein-disulfide reductase DsbD domain-containing protein [Vineibacter terrae]HEX2885805.1 protein-disulfide reductase DsbD domain-containing protein [Vineibacter terrae]
MFTAVAIAAMALLPGTVQAAGSDWARTDQTQVRLISAVDGVGDSRSVTLGLQFRMKPGWKVYWRAPGDAGFPPSVDWGGSANLGGSQILWPAPLRFDVSGLSTIGYKHEVVLPIQATLAEPGKPLSVKAKVDYLTCDDVCIPYTATFALDLPASAATPSAEAPLIAAAMAALPRPAGVDSATFATPTVSEIDAPGGKVGEQAVLLSVVVHATQPLKKPDLFVEHPKVIVAEEASVQLEDGGRRAVITSVLVGDKLKAADLTAGDMVLTLVDAAQSVEGTVRAATGAMPAASAAVGGRAPDDGLWSILLVALLGGLVLNLMPCVLPVLSLKVLGAIGHGGSAPARVRAGFLASAAGVITSFLVLAGAAVALKQAGLAVGWGIQFQQPAFIAFMVVVVLLFALNLAGVFEIPLPSWLAETAVAGEQRAGRSELAGHFVAGAFATLLATPCSAPFVGTALSFALSRGALEIVAVFLALGIGLAAPYLLLAAFPRLAARLPRPGAWMVTLKKLLSLALFATAVWLLSVLMGAAGTQAVIAAVAAVVVMSVLLMARRRVGRAAVPAAVLAALAATVLPAMLASTTVPAAAAVDGRWTRLDATRDIAAQVRQAAEGGKLVLVDVTADWCVTCQVNKRLVLNADTVVQRLADAKAVSLKVDWTRPSEAISQYLAANGRYGIPFNIVYGPGAPQGIALPELLSIDAVMQALDKAAGR